MFSVSLETSVLLIRIAFLIGAFTDFLAIFPLLSKSISTFIFGSRTLENNSGANYAMGIGASLMAGWTLLLLWGSLMPMERRDLLIITVVPVIIGIVIATIMATKRKYLELKRVVPLIIHLSLLSIYYIFSYIISMQFVK